MVSSDERIGQIPKAKKMTNYPPTKFCTSFERFLPKLVYVIGNKDASITLSRSWSHTSTKLLFFKTFYCFNLLVWWLSTVFSLILVSPQALWWSRKHGVGDGSGELSQQICDAMDGGVQTAAAWYTRENEDKQEQLRRTVWEWDQHHSCGAVSVQWILSLRGVLIPDVGCLSNASGHIDVQQNNVYQHWLCVCVCIPGTTKRFTID